VNSKETTNLTALPPHSTISVISLTLLKIYAQESALIKMIKTKKVINRKPSSTSTLKSKGKVTNISSHNKENLKEKENKD